MAITINGSGTITGISAGGLPDGSVTAADLASSLDLSGKTITNMNPSGVYLGGTGSANYLADYETGTFTPTVYAQTTTTPATMTTQNGYYVKIGNMVHIDVRVNWNGLAGSGIQIIGGLPFASKATAYEAIGAVMYDNFYTGAKQDVVAYMTTNVSTVYFYTSVNNGAWSALDYDATASMRFSLTYQTD